jgi:ankyrin repeat protein
MKWAMLKGDAKTGQRTLNAGADPNYKIGMAVHSQIRSAPLDFVVREFVGRWREDLDAQRANQFVKPKPKPLSLSLLTTWTGSRYLPMLALLLDNGAKLSMSDALEILEMGGTLSCPELVQVVLHYGAHLDLVNSDTGKVMLWAASGGCVEVLRLLLEYGFPDVQPVDRRHQYYGQGPLATTISKGHVAAAQVLLERAVNANPDWPGEFRPLHHLFMTRFPGKEVNTEMLRLLLQHGADPNQRDAQGAPLLLMAMGYEHDSEIAKLVESGADIHWRDRNGSTLLHLTIRDRSYSSYAVLKLAELGVDLNARDNQGRTALFHEVDESYYRDHEYDDYDSEHVSKAWRTLLKLPINLDSPDACGWTALHILATHEEPRERMGMLIAAGADINVKTITEGWTPLHIATARLNFEMVEALLELGANPDIWDHEGKRSFDVFSGRTRKFSEIQHDIRGLLRAKSKRLKREELAKLEDELRADGGELLPKAVLGEDF